MFVAVVAHARYGHPLRFYITPHCPHCPALAALKLRLVPVTASRPLGEGNRRYAKWPSLEPVAQPSALPGRWHALRAAVCAPLWLSWHLGICQALRALFWSVACGQSCGVCPRPPLCFAAARHQPCALVCPSAPRGGSLSPRALVVSFATGLVAAPARNTGATGLTACKPAWPLAYFFILKRQAATASALSCTLGVQWPRSSCTTMRCLTIRSTVLMRSITRQIGSLP